ncbi:hypothetical protein D3C79_638020 [compost metagenome]
MGQLQHDLITIPAIGPGTETIEHLFEIDRFIGFFRDIEVELDLLLGPTVRILLAQVHIELRNVVGHDDAFKFLQRIGAATLEQ